MGVWITKHTENHEIRERAFALFAAFRGCRGPNCPSTQVEIEAMTRAVLERVFQEEVPCFSSNGAV
jgi:hypothetical protein